MNNNQRSWMYGIIAIILSLGGYLYNNVELIAVAMLALMMSIYALMMLIYVSDVIKRKTED